MTTFSLLPHPDAPPRAVAGVNVALEREGGALHLTYTVEARTAGLVIPQPNQPLRTDGLWRTTCLEFFMMTGKESYREYNFSPSSAWAAYRFSGYRRDMEALPVGTPPVIRRRDGEGDKLVVTATIELESDADDLRQPRIALTAVIEERGGAKSYWALAHAPGPPDFHNRDCFIATLSAPTGA